MRRKRASSFIIDFIIMIIAFAIIKNVIPETNYTKKLKAEENEIIESYTAGQINFNDYFKQYSEVKYELDKQQISVNILYLVFVLLYFILLPFLWKGRTLGTYINGLQIERFDKGSLHIYQLLIRNIIVVGLGYLIVSNLCVFILPKKYYFITISVVGLLQVVMAIFSANMIMFTKEKRGLQDLISNTEMTRIIKKKKAKKH